MLESHVKFDNYVIVNIWTSENNEAIRGVNVGHVSLQTKDNYMSLWPGTRADKDRELKKLEKIYLRYFQERAPTYRASYDEDSVYEALSEGRGREIKDIKELKLGEISYVVNSSTGRVLKVIEQPLELEADSCLIAIIPVLANVRVVLYNLRLDHIEKEFSERIKRTPGWRLIGSNFFTRNLTQESPENCSSLVYRLLKAGGLYVKLEGVSSSDGSSVVTPDDLVRHLVPYKRKELETFPETKAWFKNPICPDEASVEELSKKFEEIKTKKSFSWASKFGK